MEANTIASELRRPAPQVLVTSSLHERVASISAGGQWLVAEGAYRKLGAHSSWPARLRPPATVHRQLATVHRRPSYASSLRAGDSHNVVQHAGRGDVCARAGTSHDERIGLVTLRVDGHLVRGSAQAAHR